MKISELIEIVKRLAKINPDYASETSGDVSCFYCNAMTSIKEPHENDCLWLQANEAVKS